MKEKCSPDCPCESSGWRVQTISLTALEEVEINGFEGDNHELDFLKLVLRCAPMLKRMIVKLSDKASASSCRRTKLYNIFRANSSVEFYVYLSSGLMHGSQNCLYLILTHTSVDMCCASTRPFFPAMANSVTCVRILLCCFNRLS